MNSYEITTKTLSCLRFSDDVVTRLRNHSQSTPRNATNRLPMWRFFRTFVPSNEKKRAFRKIIQNS